MVSVMNASDDNLASRPITTSPDPRPFRWSARPAVVRMTTARFMRFDPASTLPRMPAVPNSRVPAIRSASSAASPDSISAPSSARVTGSGSPAIHSSAATTGSVMCRRRLQDGLFPSLRGMVAERAPQALAFQAVKRVSRRNVSGLESLNVETPVFLE